MHSLPFDVVVTVLTALLGFDGDDGFDEERELSSGDFPVACTLNYYIIIAKFNN